MSRYYEMEFSVMAFDPTRASAILRVIEDAWGDVDGLVGDPTIIQVSGRNRLAGGESEEEFADRIARQVMFVNGGPCEVHVAALYLEELPTEHHVRRPDQYARLVDARVCHNCKADVLDIDGDWTDREGLRLCADGSKHEP